MPTYEYACSACDTTHEVQQKMTDPTLTDCPECGASNLRKLFTNVGVVFKGSGFYRNDSRDAKKSSSSSGASSSSSGSSGSSSSGSSPSGSGSSSSGSSGSSADSGGSSGSGSPTKSTAPATTS